MGKALRRKAAASSDTEAGGRGHARTLPIKHGAAGSSNPPRQHVFIVIEEPAPRTFHLRDGARAIVGRAEDADLKIELPWVSRRHALLTAEGGRVHVEDLGGVNGTRVRGIPLVAKQPVEVAAGDVIEVGRTMIVQQRPADDLVPANTLEFEEFERRLADECARANRLNLFFSIVRIEIPVPAAAATSLGLLAGVLRPIDALCCVGQGHFELLLVGYSAVETQVVLRRISEHLDARGLAYRFGYAAFPRDGRSPEELFGATRAASPDECVSTSGAGVIVKDPRMREVHTLLERVARGRINVLLLGETGVGKEILAENVHRHSPRAQKPFLRLNCGAFPDSLLESELFGHERGAFTGATQMKVGLLETAHGGTVFLDEVGEMPHSIQVKLLRVLEERQVRRVGGVQSTPIDVRFVSATNRDIEAVIAEGGFRQDLYFRLAGASIRIPPLRERPTEIPDLARCFLDEACELNDIAPTPRISREASELLLAYTWPGNIRELRNAMERAVLVCDGSVILPEHLPIADFPAPDTQRLPRAAVPPPPLASTKASPLTPPPSAGPTASAGAEQLRAQLADLEKQRILQALDEHGGNQSRAARALGISRHRLISRMKDYGVPRPRIGREEEAEPGGLHEASDPPSAGGDE